MSSNFSLYCESILNVLNDGLYISDPDGNTLWVNKMYEKLTGLGPQDLVGRNVRELVQEGVFDQVVNPDVVRDGKPVTHVQHLSNGKKLVLSGYPVFDEHGELCLVLTFARDITILTQMHDQMIAQRRLIEQFVDSVAYLAQRQAKNMAPIYASRKMTEIIELLRRLAASDATVLLLGETGTGKDVMARLTHDHSARKDKMFLKVDCGGLNESLTESELFGYMPGAFTGAGSRGKAGYFEMADGGTVFLDEVGELSMLMQTRLLRVLQDGEIMRVGATTPRKVDVRVIAATNRNLAEQVEEGRFRRDLYYRLSVAVVEVPPLRERREDIGPLAEHFFSMYTTKYRKEMSPGPDVMEAFRNYGWPGNVRQLQNVVHNLVITRNPGTLHLSDLPPDIAGENEDSSHHVPDALLEEHRPLKEIMADIERDILRKALKKHGSVQKVADMFQINRTTLFRKLRSGMGGHGQETPEEDLNQAGS